MRRYFLLSVSVALLTLLASGVALAAFIRCDGGRCKGTPRADGMRGTDGRDIMYAFEGKDVLRSFGGRDDLYGFENYDELFGGMAPTSLGVAPEEIISMAETVPTS